MPWAYLHQDVALARRIDYTELQRLRALCMLVLAYFWYALSRVGVRLRSPSAADFCSVHLYSGLQDSPNDCCEGSASKGDNRAAHTRS